MARPHFEDEEEFLDPDAYEPPSKSQLKRESDALQKLGVELASLGRQHLKKLDLPEKLLDALLQLQKITSGPALKRQKQYVGRLMRDVDPAPIQAVLDSIKGNNDQQTAWLHQIERQREELLASDEAVQQLITEQPEVDIQALRQMVRNARAERAAIESGQQKPPKHFRALFQLLKELYPEPKLDTAAEDEDEDDEEDDD